jgi:hypothetical protein
MTEPVFLMGLAIVATSVVMVVRTIAGAIGGRGASGSEVARLREQVEQQAAALDDAHQMFADQSAQLAELQERMDFTERLLTRESERNRLADPDRPGP